MKLSFSRLVAAFLTVFIAGWTVSCNGASSSSTAEISKAASLLKAKDYQQALQVAGNRPAEGSLNLLAGKAALRLKRYDDAISYLKVAEANYPLLADVATSLKADAFYAKKEYREAVEAANRVIKFSNSTALSRRMAKLAADGLFQAGDLKAALAAYRGFTARYSLGKDYVDALYQTAVCQENTGELKAAITGLRDVYLKYPASAQSAKAFEHLSELKKNGVADALTFTPQELFQRGQLLLVNNQPASAFAAFSAISRNNLSDELLSRIDLKSAQAVIRQRHYNLAEPFLKRAVISPDSTVRDEARLMLARLEERQGASDKALARLLSLAAEKKSLAPEAMLEMAMIYKKSGHFSESEQILKRLIREFPASEIVSRAGWELAWGQYRAGNMPAAEESMHLLFKSATYRERALYWHARSKERQNRLSDAEAGYRQLLGEFPFGFYAAWYRTRTDLSTGWPHLSANYAEPPLPQDSQRVQALAFLGLMEEARAELSELKSNNTDKGMAPGLARIQNIAGDLHGSLVTFHQNRPSTIDSSNMPFWAIGFPRPYSELFSRYSNSNGLSEAFVISLAKAESSFRPEVKSHAGAIGLMQLMPATARMTDKEKGKNFNPLMLTVPEYNIRLGTKHLRDLLNQYQQDPVYTLAAYNAGAGAVNRWRKSFGELPKDEFIESIPYMETRDYVKKIVAYMEIYRALYRIK